MRFKQAFLPRKTRPGEHGYLGFWLLGLFTLYEGLVITISLGFLNVDARAYALLELWDDDK